MLCREIQTGVLIIILFNLFVSVEACNPQLQGIHDIHVKSHNLKYLKKDGFELINEIYKVKPQRPLRIIFKDCFLERVICQTHTHSYKIGKFTPRIAPNVSRDSVIEVEKVTDYMSDIWECAVFQINYKIRKYILFEIIVEDAKPPQKILVNNNILPITHKTHVGYYEAMYYYRDGDEIEVVCVSSNDNNCSLNINSSNALTKTVSLRSDVSYRFILKADFIKEIVCTCYAPDNYNKSITLVATFVLQDIFQDILKLTINDRIVRGLRYRVNVVNDLFITDISYAYHLNETIMKIVCETENHDYNLSWPEILSTVNKTVIQHHKYSVKFNITPSKILKIKFRAQHKQLREEIVITFKQLNKYAETQEIDLEQYATDDQNSAFLWIVLLVVIIVIILLICVATTIIYKKRKRNHCVQRKPDADTTITACTNQGQSDSSLSQVQLNPEEHIYEEPVQESATKNFKETLEYDYVYNHLT